MDYKYIEQLLDRYFEGETTLQEEQILKAFFAQGKDNMPVELSRYASFFAMLNDKEVLDDSFEHRVLDMTVGTTTVKARTVSLAERLRPLFKAAAVVAILLTVGNAINQSFMEDDTWIDTEQYANVDVATGDAAIAYEQVSDSVSFDKGSGTVLVDTLKQKNN